MNNNDYYDYTFYLKLSWENGLIYVQNMSPPSGSDELDLSQESEKFSWGQNYKESWFSSDVTGNDHGFIKFGEKIANLLLPGEIRVSFLNMWDDQTRIRLCLLYPKDPDQTEELLKVPWEYIYLPKKNASLSETTVFHQDYLLAQNPNISIVHWLYPYIESQPGIKKLKARIKYLSWFEEEETQEIDILRAFVGELSELEPIINCTNINYREFEFELNNDPGLEYSKRIRVNSYDGGPEDVVIDALNHDFIQVTSHGSHLGITLEGGRVLTPEALSEFFITEPGQSQIKVAIFLNCLSVDSIARTLHQKGVPVVIGVANSIGFRPIEIFVSGFYSALVAWPADGLEKAMAYGRKSICLNEVIRTQFGYPRLFLNGRNSFLISEDLLFGNDDTVKSFDEFIAKEANLKDFHSEKNQLTSWVKQDETAPQKWFLVIGPPSSGKSALIAWLLNELKKDNANNPKIIYHFCLDKLPETKHALAFVRDSLAPQLRREFGDDYKKQISPGRFPLLVSNADQALRDFVIHPLRKLVEQDKANRPVIVIDGLSVVPELLDADNSILGLLLRYRDELQEVARFLITADTNEADPFGNQAEAESRDDIHWNICTLTFHKYGEFDIKISEVIDPSILLGQMALRFHLSELIPVSATQASERRFWSDLYKLFNIAVKNAIEQAIEEAAIEILGDKPSYYWWQEKVHRLLNVVAIAYEPLYARDAAVIIGLGPDSPEKKILLSALRFFFKSDDLFKVEERLIFYHPILKTYRLHEMNWWNAKKTQSLADTHELFVNACYSNKPETDWASVTGWITLAGTKWSGLSENSPATSNKIISRYMRRYLVYHAFYSYNYTSWRKLSKRREHAKTFLKLICDPVFRQARENEVGQQAALQDIQLGLRVINVEYIYASKGKTRKMTRIAFDRLLAAQQPNSYRRNELIKLEQALQLGQSWRNEHTASWEDLFYFLGFENIEWWQR